MCCRYRTALLYDGVALHVSDEQPTLAAGENATRSALLVHQGPG